MMLRVPFITLLITAAFAVNAAAQDASTLSALSPTSTALLSTIEDGTVPASWQAPPPSGKDSRLNGFLIGFAAGAIPGIWLGMGISTYCENESTSCPAMIPIFGTLFGFAGGGIGYAIDGAIGQSMTIGRPRPKPGVRFSIRF
jgi:hypothetical protein